MVIYGQEVMSMPHRNDLLGWYKLRWKILNRDNYTCQYCGQSAPNVLLEVDHKVPLVDGGTDDESNLVTSCWACNRGKNGLRQSIILKRQKTTKKVLLLRQPQILELMRRNPQGVTSQEVSTQLQLTRTNTYTILSRLKKKAMITKNGERWRL